MNFNFDFCLMIVSYQQGPEDSDGAVVVRAIRDIQVGEEITISYVDDSLPCAERREQLREYQFTCMYVSFPVWDARRESTYQHISSSLLLS